MSRIDKYIGESGCHIPSWAEWESRSLTHYYNGEVLLSVSHWNKFQKMMWQYGISIPEIQHSRYRNYITKQEYNKFWGLPDIQLFEHRTFSNAQPSTEARIVLGQIGDDDI